jgi:hypothetical protein
MSIKSQEKFKLYVAIQIPNELIETLKIKNLDVHVAKLMPMTRQQLLEEISHIDCHAILCTPGITLDKDLFDLTPNLKVLFVIYEKIRNLSKL